MQLYSKPQYKGQKYKYKINKKIILKMEKKKTNQHCSGSVPGVAIDAYHGAGVRVELIHQLGLGLKNMVVLPHKVSTHLNKTKWSLLRLIIMVEIKGMWENEIAREPE